MEMKRFIKSIGVQALLLILIFGAIGFSTYTAIDQIAARQDEDQSKAIEIVLIKAAVQCYALEGSYPPDLNYLKDHYGVILNETKYFYFYEAQGSNILPKIMVIRR
jgi:hypothetical protein